VEHNPIKLSRFNMIGGWASLIDARGYSDFLWRSDESGFWSAA
jgi:hypothetical protein